MLVKHATFVLHCKKQCALVQLTIIEIKQQLSRTGSNYRFSFHEIVKKKVSDKKVEAT